MRYCDERGAKRENITFVDIGWKRSNYSVKYSVVVRIKHLPNILEGIKKNLRTVQQIF